MFTYKFFSHAARGNALTLRLTNNRRKAEFFLGLEIAQPELDDILHGRITKGNLRVRNLVSDMCSKLDSLKVELLEKNMADIDVSDLKVLVQRLFKGEVAEINGQPKKESDKIGEFVNWFSKYADSHITPGTRTKDDCYHTLSRLRAYSSAVDEMAFEDLTVGWLEDFDIFLAKTCKVNSRNHHMRVIRAAVKYAIRHDVDVRNPFDRMRLKTEETEKRSLKLDELRRLVTMEVLPYAEVFRDMFVLSFMLIGINPKDLYYLQEVEDGRLNYRRAKTHKLFSIKVEPEAQSLIEKYKGTSSLLMLADRWKLYDSFGKAANNALRKIGARPSARGRKKSDQALFPQLTMYWARHTWATIAAELDIPDATISLALGHSGENRVTDIYIKRNQRKVDDANRQVLDWVLYGKKKN